MYRCFPGTLANIPHISKQIQRTINKFHILQILPKLYFQKYMYVMFCAIWYHFNNLKNLKNTHGGFFFLIKLQAKVLFLRCFSRFLNCTMVPIRATHHILKI